MDQVSLGTPVGTVADAGFMTPDHLHLGIGDCQDKNYSNPVDNPLKVIISEVEADLGTKQDNISPVIHDIRVYRRTTSDGSIPGNYGAIAGPLKKRIMS
jgi:hypothetical protein